MKKVIGITGGIASGKSNACNVITELGYPVIDCDKISYDLSQKGGSLYHAILKHFGSEFLNENGEINRKKLGNLIFNNRSKKTLLDEITHPIIREEVLRQIDLYNNDLVFIEVPLLFESDFNKLCDKTVCVYLPKEFQLKRLMLRDGIDESYALAKIHSQMDLNKKKTLADFVVDSRGSFEETKSQVLNIIEQIKGV